MKEKEGKYGRRDREKNVGIKKTWKARGKVYRENNGKLFNKDEAISKEKFKRISHANETNTDTIFPKYKLFDRKDLRSSTI